MEEKYGPLLRARLALHEDAFEVNILVAGKPAADLSPELGREPFIAAVKGRVNELQQGVLAQLATDIAAGQASDIGLFWVDNTIGATVDRQALAQLSKRGDVIQIEIARRAPLSELLDGWSQEGALFLSACCRNRSGPHPTWSVDQIGAPRLWNDFGVTGDGVVVAVVDTGVNFLHPDLAGRAWDGSPSFPDHGYNFENPGQPPVDGNGHGTSIASLVAGEGKEGSITGAAPAARIMALRAGSKEQDAVCAFQFALDHGAHVICMAQTWKKNTDQDRERWRRKCEVVLAPVSSMPTVAATRAVTLTSGFRSISACRGAAHPRSRWVEGLPPLSLAEPWIEAVQRFYAFQGMDLSPGAHFLSTTIPLAVVKPVWSSRTFAPPAQTSHPVTTFTLRRTTRRSPGARRLRERSPAASRSSPMRASVRENRSSPGK